jgi:hypothetical protein
VLRVCRLVWDEGQTVHRTQYPLSLLVGGAVFLFLFLFEGNAHSELHHLVVWLSLDQAKKAPVGGGAFPVGGSRKGLARPPRGRVQVGLGGHTPSSGVT